MTPESELIDATLAMAEALKSAAQPDDKTLVRKIVIVPVKNGLFMQPKDVGPDRELVEGHNRMRFANKFDFADEWTGNTRTYDPEGRYNCGRCNMRYDDYCLMIPGDINTEAGSCRHWEDLCAGDPEYRLTDAKCEDREAATYGQAANGDGFGCWRCPFASKAFEPDSKGRNLYCGKGDFRTGERACCQLNGAAVVSPDKESVAVSESLKHPKHADKLKPIKAEAATLMARFFRAQSKALIKEIGPHLKQVAHGLREDSTSTSMISHALPDGSLLPIVITAGMSVDYSAALTAAITAGYTTLAEDLGSTGNIGSDVMGSYLRDHSLEKLTGDISSTSVDRLRTALADAYESGADYAGLVQVIRDQFAEFSDFRAQMIAQTEMNDAYNEGRKQLGLDLGFNQKSWNPDGAACELCMGNVADGWIGIEEEFSSGDDAPTAHPNCDCSLDVRFSADA